MLKPAIHFVLSGIILCSIMGFGAENAKSQSSEITPEETLYKTGIECLEKQQYLKARLAFETLINTYPDSDLAAVSYLAIGDSFYNEGGDENLLFAEDQYRKFIEYHPTHPKVSVATIKIIATGMKMVRSPDRNDQYRLTAIKHIERFLEQFPDSDYAPMARELLGDIQRSYHNRADEDQK